MKINPKELQQIIKEEAIRLKKKMMLEDEKASILKKLQEMEECEIAEGMVDEGMFGMMGADEVARKNALDKQFDALVASGAIGNKAAFEAKAKTDNHNGTISAPVAGGGNPKFAGKRIIVYTLKPTTMQKLGAAAGNVTGGGGVGEKQAPL